MIRALQAPVLIDPPLLRQNNNEINELLNNLKDLNLKMDYRKRGKTMRAAVIDSNPFAGVGVFPEDDVAVEELERSGALGIEVLYKGNWVPMIPP